MGKGILIDTNNLNLLVESFFSNNKQYQKKEVRSFGNKIICVFFAKGEECRVDIYVNADSIKPVLACKNKELAIPFIEFLEKSGIKDNQISKQYVIKHVELVDELIKYLEQNYSGKIEVSVNDNIIRLRGFNNDRITITKNHNNFVIQGKPYYLYHIIMTYLSESSLFDFDEYVRVNQEFSENVLPANLIRDKIKSMLVNSYSYMEETQLKSISSSFSFINNKIVSEDYSGALTGTFKALEGFLKKVLTKRFNYILQEKQTFSIFGKDKNTGMSVIDRDKNMTTNEKACLNKLYNIYNDKRNVYLHSTVDPSLMTIIEDYKEAEDLRDEILENIENAYNIIF